MHTVIDYITVITGVLSLVALVFVAWQLILARKDVRLAEITFGDARRATELNKLPEAYLILEVRAKLEYWKENLQQLVAEKEAIIRRIKANDRLVSQQFGIDGPRGLVSRGLYEALKQHPWLQMILIAGAQYYYDCKASAHGLSHYENMTFRLSVLRGIIQRAELGIQRIDEMLLYINDMLPKWFLECPASLSDSDFLS